MEKIIFQIFESPHNEQEIELLATFEGYVLSELPKNMLEELNKVIRELKENNFGVYYSGGIDWDGDKKESYWIKYTFRCENKQLLNFIKCNKIEFNNKQELETIMAKNKAPYAMWAITALKNECKKRKFVTEDYEKVTDKLILVEMLKQDDVSEKPTPIEEKVEDKKEKSDDLGDDLGDEFDLDEEPEKEKVEEKVEEKKTDSKKKVDKPKVEEKKVDKPKKSGNLIPINQRLKESGYWVKGAQFLSNVDKEALIVSKNQKERDVIYIALEKKVAGISVTLSAKMKLVAAEKGSVGVKKTEIEKVNPIEESETYGDFDLAELRKQAVSRKSELSELGISPKKSDTADQLRVKLIQADSSK